MAGPTRKDTQRVTLQIKDPVTGRLINYGVWDKRSGGNVSSTIYKYKPGSMQPQVSLGGTRSTDDVTLSRLYRQERDHTEMQRLINWAGHAVATVSQTPLDTDGNPFPPPIVWTGILQDVNIPEHDSESTDPAMIELVVSPNGDPTVT